jgi:hypothetical protein
LKTWPESRGWQTNFDALSGVLEHPGKIGPPACFLQNSVVEAKWTAYFIFR